MSVVISMREWRNIISPRSDCNCELISLNNNDLCSNTQMVSSVCYRPTTRSLARQHWSPDAGNKKKFIGKMWIIKIETSILPKRTITFTHRDAVTTLKMKTWVVKKLVRLQPDSFRKLLFIRKGTFVNRYFHQNVLFFPFHCQALLTIL